MDARCVVCARAPGRANCAPGAILFGRLSSPRARAMSAPPDQPGAEGGEVPASQPMPVPEDPTPCAVCLRSDSDGSEAMVYCGDDVSGCGICVHESCVKMQSVPGAPPAC